ncbi:MAG TPA: alpha-ketoglutarate-dependent dioxygenase AlkB [Blastocatellia bacterium]|nr:alpha-ketoglutarate-dependent dioxygenase AlkB [Blastocatellia bacterium]
MPDAEIFLDQAFFSAEESDRLFRQLSEQIAWRQEKIRLYGKEFNQPRLTAWYGDAGASYTYSNLTLQPLAWIAPLTEIRERCGEAAGVNFNSVLLNLYRDGQDSMGWHQDNEPELGVNPVIASVSLGATRQFQFRHKKRKDLSLISLELTHGSLLLMKGTTQHYWRHQVPKSSKVTEARINLTFRVIRHPNSGEITAEL